MKNFEYLLKKFSKDIQGKVILNDTYKHLYATDASAYREIPIAVIYPENSNDIKKIIHFCNENEIHLIPRTAGTSLAGQVVGNGIIIDISKNFNKILNIDINNKRVTVEPGVILDELNIYLRKYNLFFAPETSTSNRCMIGGMIGNNSCGAHSLIYGSTRDHLISVKGFLSDGSEVVFENIKTEEIFKKINGNSLESRIYKKIYEILSNEENQKNIKKEFPDPSIKRRNHGYAIDVLLETDPFVKNGIPFNISKLIAGSEGTLMFITEATLNLVPLPPKNKALLCAHFNTLEEALEANLIALKFNPDAVELIDHYIIECTKNNIEQRKNRFFIKGEPGGILIIEFTRETMEEIYDTCSALEKEMRKNNYGYHFPIVTGSDINKVWALRKAGLGVLTNIPGDAKPVSVIEDTSVNPSVLPQYIKEFKTILSKYNLNCVYHAHIATGELHLRPVLNLKDPNDVKKFREIATEVAYLVKKYRGSLSGEHGDGRLRGEFLPIMIGEKNYQLLKEIKETFDEKYIFNRGKIINTPPMDSNLRYIPGKPTPEFKTIFDFSNTHGYVRMAEMCNGSADCRKSHIFGGVMCPTYMATKDEYYSTRARANLIRETFNFINIKNPFSNKELYKILDNCISCKGCKTECPSNVDITKLKAEFLQHYYKYNFVPLRTYLIANINKLMKFASLIPSLYNKIAVNKFFSKYIKKIIGFAQERYIPLVSKITLSKWTNKNLDKLNKKINSPIKSVYLFIDEFTEYQDTEIGIKAIKLLISLGYEVKVLKLKESGRTYLSKGLIRKAKKIAIYNIEKCKNHITESNPLIGIEPSTILTFRDEYIDLVPENLKEIAKKIAKNTFTIDEFIANEYEKGNIKKELFTEEIKTIKHHGHCYQKALSSTKYTIKMLSIPINYKVEEIPSGCCGMAGSFGYEKEHYELSMKIGELVLFPEIRKCPPDTIISASGTSCRQQIIDGTRRKALHPIEILYEALKNKIY